MLLFSLDKIEKYKKKHHFVLVLNVAAGKAPMQSSVAEGGIPQKAVDGSTSTFFDLSTCSLTEVVISVCLFVWIEIELN